MNPRRFAADRDRGAVLVEAAFVLPILFAFVLGLLDFSIWEFQNSQVTNAARDGARTGVVLPLTGPAAATTTAAIEESVRARLAGSDYDDLTIVTFCEGGGGATIATSCTSAVPGVTRLTVEVSWSYEPVSFVGSTFGTVTIESTASMVYEGAREGSGVGSNICVLSGLQARTPIPTLSGGALSRDLVVDFETNGAAACSGISATMVRLLPPVAPETLPSIEDPTSLTWNGSVNGSGTTLTVTFDQSNTGFTSADYEVAVTVDGRSAYVLVPLLQPPECSVASIDSIKAEADANGNKTLRLQNKTSTSLKNDMLVTFSAADVCTGIAATATLSRADGTGATHDVAIPDLANGEVVFPRTITGFPYQETTYVVTLRWPGAEIQSAPFPVVD